MADQIVVATLTPRKYVSKLKKRLVYIYLITGKVQAVAAYIAAQAKAMGCNPENVPMDNGSPMYFFCPDKVPNPVTGTMRKVQSQFKLVISEFNQSINIDDTLETVQRNERIELLKESERARIETQLEFGLITLPGQTSTQSISSGAKELITLPEPNKDETEDAMNDLHNVKNENLNDSVEVFEVDGGGYELADGTPCDANGIPLP